MRQQAEEAEAEVEAEVEAVGGMTVVLEMHGAHATLSLTAPI